MLQKFKINLKTEQEALIEVLNRQGFWVIYMTSMPSVLVETGFITNPDEEKYLVSEEGQDYNSIGNLQGHT